MHLFWDCGQVLSEKPFAKGGVGQKELELRCLMFAKGEWMQLIELANSHVVGSSHYNQHSPEGAALRTAASVRQRGASAWRVSVARQRGASPWRVSLSTRGNSQDLVRRAATHLHAKSRLAELIHVGVEILLNAGERDSCVDGVRKVYIRAPDFDFDTGR